VVWGGGGALVASGEVARVAVSLLGSRCQWWAGLVGRSSPLVRWLGGALVAVGGWCSWALVAVRRWWGCWALVTLRVMVLLGARRDPWCWAFISVLGPLWSFLCRVVLAS
jgi:hypothetical protein